MNEIDTIDSNVYDVNDMVGTDININPDYYIHHALLKAQTCLIKDDVKMGFLQFRIIVEHLEVLCRASKMIDEDYLKLVRDFKETDQDYLNADKDTKEVKLANKKLGLLANEIFSKRTKTDPLIN